MEAPLQGGGPTSPVKVGLLPPRWQRRVLALWGWGRRAVSGQAGRHERGCAEEVRALGWVGGLLQPLSELGSLRGRPPG